MGMVPAKSFMPSAPYGASPAANVLNPAQPAAQNPQTPLLPPNFTDPGTMQSKTAAPAASNPFTGGGGSDMRRLFGSGLFGILLFFMLGSSLCATTTVTGHITDLSGTAATSSFVRFTLKGCGGNQPTVNGTAIFAPTQGSVWYKDFAANATGDISGTIYSTRDVTGLLGGDITCGSSTTSVWYGMTVWQAGKSGPEVAVHAKNTATLNVTSVTPITTTPVVTAPTGDGTYLRLDAGNSPETGNVAFTGNNTHSGTETFSGPIQLSGGTCSAAGITAALAAVAVGGTVDARGCTTAFTWSSLVTISNPVTLWLPCANVTFTTQLLNITADDVHVHGCGAGGSGAISIYNSPTAGSVYTASGLGAGVNAIVAYKGNQGTLQAQRQSAFTLDNLIINMNGVGNRAISTSSCWSCKIDQVIIQNANCSDGAFFQEASNPAGLLLTESYFMHMDNVLVTIAQANTTCHPFMFDASRGEIAYATYTNLTAIGYPQAAGSGSDSVYINTGATNVSQSFDQNIFLNLKTQDPTTGAWGIKLQARGNFGGTLASSFIRTNGSIFNVQFVDAQPERIFSTGGSGTGIGCINAAGSADGTGCAFLSNSNFSSGGWANNEDSLNMGAGYMSVGSNSAVLQGPIFRQTGLHNGSNSNFERIDPNYQPTANSQTGFSVFVVPNTINPNNFTGATLHGIQVDLADGTHTGGNFANAYGFYCNGFGSWVTAEWCFYGVGASGNHSDSWWEIGGASVANPGGLANTGRVWYDQTNQLMNLNNNNTGARPITTAPTSVTTTQALFATATAGQPAFRALATADIATALTTPGPIGGTTPSTGKFTTLTETNLLISNTAPTIAGAGCGGSAASIPSNNGTAAFTINVGTAPTAGGCTVTLPTATTGWNCYVTDITTNSTAVFLQKQTSSTTTSAVLVNYSDVAAATAPTASDIWRVSCFAY